MPKMRPYGKVKEIIENDKVIGYMAGDNGFKYMAKNGDLKSAKSKAEAQLQAMKEKDMKSDMGK